jgi:DNA end-binding protein Ku
VAPRAYWKGYLKLSLVSCPIALFPATSEREKISFHQLNKNTGHRIKYQKVDAESGDQVESADIIKGYQVGKGEYLEIEPEELEAIAIESKRTIDIDEFVPRKERVRAAQGNRRALFQQPLLHRAGWRGRTAGVRRDPGGDPPGGHGRHRKGGLHLTRARHRIGSPRQRPLGVTLRCPYEVRNEKEYFDDVTDEKIPKDMLELATHIVGSKAGHFEPERFEDQYEDALQELLRKKQSGEKIEAPREREPSKVVNLMDALRRSVETERGGAERRKPAPRAGDHRAPKKAGRSSARAKKAS